MALTNDGYKRLGNLPGVTVKDIKPPKVKYLSDKQIEKVFAGTGFRIIQNKNGIIKMKHGYGMKKPTIIFDCNRRVNVIEPMSFVKNVPRKVAEAIETLTNKLI